MGTQISGLRKLDFVLDQLSRYSGETRKINAASTFVSCPFHNEKTPSGRIFHSPATKSPGYFKCYGCGKSVGWDEVAPLLGLEAYKWAKPSEQFARTITEELQEDDESRKFKAKYSKIPANKIWREIPTNLLIDIGARKVRYYYPESDFLGETMVWLPVMVKNERRGFIRARLRKQEDKPSYLNQKGQWSSDFGLFPYDYAVREQRKVLILVEGPRDALFLLNLGFPAVAILGTQSFSARKARMIELSGAEHVILAMDGDDAGIKAVELIEPQLRRLVNVEVFKLTGKDSPYHKFRHEDSPSKAAKEAGVSLWDPATLPKRKLKELRELVRRLESGSKDD